MQDNAGLYHALKSGKQVVPVFIFDTDILDKLPNKADRRVDFIWRTLQHLQTELTARGSTLHVLHGKPVACFQRLLDTYTITGVYTNHDYEPAAETRDAAVRSLLQSRGIALHTYKDQAILEKDEVLKDDGKPYTVFTPYSRRWKQTLTDFHLKPYPTERYMQNLLQQPPIAIPTLEQLGFAPTDLVAPAPGIDLGIAAKYNETRDYPALHGTTRQSVHLRFGTVSIRQLAAQAKTTNEVLLNELIWRDFYMCILWHFPHVVTQSFKKEYDRIVWDNNEAHFKRWCEGQTGVPIVDAGMRELNTTGYMHNRVRMITASFLVKNLLIDWRLGEAYFAEKLLDYDLSVNNGAGI